MKCLLHKGIKSRITAIFVIFLKHIFLKITVSITLKVVNRPNKKFVLFAIFLNCCFAIICHKKSRLFGQIGLIFENMYHENKKLYKLERVFLLCLSNYFIILSNINTFYAFVLQKIKTYYLYLILTSFLHCVIREILGSVLKPLFLCCNAIRREEVCKQVGCERERLTLYINNTNFPLISMQQLKHIIFQNLLNESRMYQEADFAAHVGGTSP